MLSLARRQELLQELRRIAAPARTAWPERAAATGIGALDEVLGGGLPKGRVTELIGCRSAGRTALALSTFAMATARGEAVALVDVEGMLDARDAEAAGIDLGLLLWVHAGEVKRGVRASELILRAGGFGVVALDVGETPPRVPDSAWLRLGRATESSGVALVLSSPRRVAGSFAAVTLAASQPRPRFLDGDDGAPRVLEGAAGRFEVAHSKLGVSGAVTTIDWRR